MCELFSSMYVDSLFPTYTICRLQNLMSKKKDITRAKVGDATGNPQW